ncbi:MAG: AmmeMemoRadiSam system radical SAM enzyme [Candidatus Nanohaloarchaeota archaeon QJJ-9]|nr:AmmeMemoRadiSam system radical SAM enzyme [Candidatus Nanohaloarchaeota archaeon QJJ-9]
MVREVELYEKLEGKKVRCKTCPRECTISPGQKGFCRVRENQDGELVLLTYGRSVSSSIDSVEKKPLFHFAPGSRVFSIATVGCTLNCDFCQNFSISHEWNEIKGKELPPEKVVSRAKDSCDGIAYTYTEPTVFLEYAYDSMRESGNLYNVFVSNGYMTDETVELIAPHIDAVNIDLKGKEKFYREKCKVPDPQPIYEAMKKFKEKDVFLEVTNLIIPGENDSEEEIRERVDWIIENLGKDTPVHFSRFRPAYRMNEKPPTPVKTLEKAVNIAEDEDLNYVYCGNVPGHEKESTECPNCGERVVKRVGFTVEEFKIDIDGCCEFCGHQLNFEGLKYSPERFFNGN